MNEVWKRVKFLTNFSGCSKIYDFTTAGRTFKADLDILHGFTNSIIAERKKIYLEKAKNG